MFAILILVFSGCASTPDDYSPYIHQRAENDGFYLEVETRKDG